MLKKIFVAVIILFVASVAHAEPKKIWQPEITKDKISMPVLLEQELLKLLSKQYLMMLNLMEKKLKIEKI